MDYTVLYPQVEHALREASHYMTDAFTVDEKESPCNIVTSADLSIQHFLEEALCALLPGSAVFGEEGCNQSAEGEYLWIVDPIDGTTNFSRGLPECCISVCLLHQNTPVLGIVHSPSLNQTFSAIRGKGAYCNGKSIHVSNRPFREGLLCTAMSLYRKEFAPACLAVISEAYESCNDIRRIGTCALELCYLASGACDLYFEFRVFPWDYAGAALILEESGGIICGANGEALTFDRATPIIAANNLENFNTLNAIVRKHIPEFPYKEILR